MPVDMDFKCRDKNNMKYETYENYEVISLKIEIKQIFVSKSSSFFSPPFPVYQGWSMGFFFWGGGNLSVKIYSYINYQLERVAFRIQIPW